MKNRVEELIRVYEWDRFKCHCCGHLLEDPTPLQKVESVAKYSNVDHALASIAHRAYRKKHGI